MLKNTTKVNLATQIGQDSRHLLHTALSIPKASGKKALVIARPIFGLVARIADPAFLKEHGYESISYLDGDALAPSSPPSLADYTSIVYMVRSDAALIHRVVDHASALLNWSSSSTTSQPNSTAAAASAAIIAPTPATTPASGSDKHIFLLCLPRAGLLTRQILRERGVLANVQVHDLPIDLVALEDDLLSLELPSLCQLAAHKDMAAIHHLVQAVLALETSIGSFACIRGSGELAKSFYAMHVHLAATFDAPRPPSNNTLILIDRAVDFVTPLMTPQTYSGMVDHLCDIQFGFVETESMGRTRKHKLSKADDPVYQKIADLDLSAAQTALQEITQVIAAHENGLRVGTLEAMQAFVDSHPDFAKLKESFAIHLKQLASKIQARLQAEDAMRLLEIEHSVVSGGQLKMDDMEELLFSGFEMHSVLATLALASQTGALSDKQLESLRQEFLLTYGFQHHQTWTRLESAGLIASARTSTPRRTAATWKTVIKDMSLLVDPSAAADPTTALDIAYVFSGYAPLSVRVVESLLQQPPSASHAGPPRPRIDAAAVARSVPQHLVVDAGAAATGGGGHVYVAYLGGVTLAEVSALRLLGQLLARPLTVITTEVLTAQRIVRGFASS
ncbi:Sec1-like protein [Blastocladiella britannica]|nr:Sec1-like protein [Blastocladiella britannica]